MKFKEVTIFLVLTIFGVAVFMALIGFNGPQIDKLINWIIPIGVSFMLSALVGEILEKFTGDFFNNIYLSFPLNIKDFDFTVNIPLFVILVFVIKFLLFN